MDLSNADARYLAVARSGRAFSGQRSVFGKKNELGSLGQTNLKTRGGSK
jgi:hypothetical protein